MKFEIKIPSVGESITEATIGQWVKKNGEAVKRNDVLIMLETDKASVEVVAENDGVLSTKVAEGQTVAIGSVVGVIDTGGVATATTSTITTATPTKSATTTNTASAGLHPDLKNHLPPAAQKIANENNLSASQIQGTGKDGRITKSDAMLAASQTGVSTTTTTATQSAKTSTAVIQAPTVTGVSKQGQQTRTPMTTIRKKTAERLVMSQQTTATLTTFNEVDMTKVIEIRNKYKDKFKEKYGVGLGFMGFFVKACVEALKAWPVVNAFMDGQDVLMNHYFNIGVAVGTEKGLIVPVIKDADLLSVAGVETTIKNFAAKARDGKITINDLSGGTFTISNGGVYGSLLSTPILNPPQTAILGMHKIEERAVVINGKIEIRSMMYLALSYDHRMIDGKEAVSFLVKIKEGIEDPERLLIEI